jgi:hypothetical protein
MRFYLDSSVQRAGGLLGGIVILATLLSYATANKRRPPETANKQPSSVALAAGPVETANGIDLADRFTERWTAVASEAYRAAVAERSRPVGEQQSRPADRRAVAAPAMAAAAPAAAPAAATPSPSSPAPQYPMAQATEDDLKQYLDEHRAKAEKNAEKNRDDICKKGRTYFYREHHQYWRCRR